VELAYDLRVDIVGTALLRRAAIPAGAPYSLPMSLGSPDLVAPEADRAFRLGVFYMISLLGLAAAYFLVTPLRDLLPLQWGIVPLAVPWWGALGAVTISLYGVFFHSTKWDPSFNYWHIGRPFLGAVLGTVGYLIFIVVINATGAKANTAGNAVYYLVAFLVGYREKTFQMLIQRATDSLFASPDKQHRPGQRPP